MTPEQRVALEAKVFAFFDHHRVAFVGLSTNAHDFSRAVAAEMKKRGLDVVPVHPHAEAIDGVPAWPRVSAIPDPPKAALLMVPKDQAAEVVADCVAAGVQAIWFHRGVGEGSESAEALALAEAAGMEVVRDACPLMFLEPAGWLHRAHRWFHEHAAT